MRLGESLGELIGAGDGVDDVMFIEKGVQEADTEDLIRSFGFLDDKDRHRSSAHHQTKDA